MIKIIDKYKEGETHTQTDVKHKHLSINCTLRARVDASLRATPATPRLKAGKWRVRDSNFHV